MSEQIFHRTPQPKQKPSHSDQSTTQIKNDIVREQVFQKLLDTFQELNTEEPSINTSQQELLYIQNMDNICEKCVTKVQAVVNTSVNKVESLQIDLYPRGLGQVSIEISHRGHHLVDVTFFVETELKKIFRHNVHRIEKELIRSKINPTIQIKSIK